MCVRVIKQYIFNICSSLYAKLHLNKAVLKVATEESSYRERDLPIVCHRTLVSLSPLDFIV